MTAAARRARRRRRRPTAARSAASGRSGRERRASTGRPRRRRSRPRCGCRAEPPGSRVSTPWTRPCRTIGRASVPSRIGAPARRAACRVGQGRGHGLDREGDVQAARRHVRGEGRLERGHLARRRGTSRSSVRERRRDLGGQRAGATSGIGRDHEHARPAARGSAERARRSASSGPRYSPSVSRYSSTMTGSNGCWTTPELRPDAPAPSVARSSSSTDRRSRRDARPRPSRRSLRR